MHRRRLPILNNRRQQVGRSCRSRHYRRRCCHRRHYRRRHCCFKVKVRLVDSKWSFVPFAQQCLEHGRHKRDRLVAEQRAVAIDVVTADNITEDDVQTVSVAHLK